MRIITALTATALIAAASITWAHCERSTGTNTTADNRPFMESFAPMPTHRHPNCVAPPVEVSVAAPAPVYVPPPPAPVYEPAPPPAPVVEPLPEKLPATGTHLPLIGLVGLLTLGAGTLVRVVRGQVS